MAAGAGVAVGAFVPGPGWVVAAVSATVLSASTAGAAANKVAEEKAGAVLKELR